MVRARHSIALAVCRALHCLFVIGSTVCFASAQLIDESPSANNVKQSVPSAQVRAQSEQLVTELFQTDAASTRDEQLDLVQKLLRTGLGSQNEPADQFALFDIARRMSADVGDLKLSFAAVDHLSSFFEFSPAVAHIDCMRRTFAVRGLSRADELVNAKIGGDYVEELIDSLDFDNARKAASLIQEFAKSTRDADLVARIKTLVSTIESRTNLSPEVEAAKRILESDPSDADANHTMGEHLFFVQGDITNGLKLLARSSDPSWSKIAELQASLPTETPEQVELADLWWALALEQSESNRSEPLQRQAAIWYVRALPDLAGLTRRKATHRSKPYGISQEHATMPAKQSTQPGLPLEVKGTANRPNDAFFPVTPAD